MTDILLQRIEVNPQNNQIQTTSRTSIDTFTLKIAH